MPETITSVGPNPHSYVGQSEHGASYVRNRQYLSKSVSISKSFFDKKLYLETPVHNQNIETILVLVVVYLMDFWFLKKGQEMYLRVHVTSHLIS